MKQVHMADQPDLNIAWCGFRLTPMKFTIHPHEVRCEACKYMMRKDTRGGE